MIVIALPTKAATVLITELRTYYFKRLPRIISIVKVTFITIIITFVVIQSVPYKVKFTTYYLSSNPMIF
jgi:hypothetical protein